MQFETARTYVIIVYREKCIDKDIDSYQHCYVNVENFNGLRGLSVRNGYLDKN